MGNRCHDKPDEYCSPRLQTERENHHQKDIYSQNREPKMQLANSYVELLCIIYNDYYQETSTSHAEKCRLSSSTDLKTLEAETSENASIHVKQTIKKGFKLSCQSKINNWVLMFHTRSSSSSSNSLWRCSAGGFGFTATVNESTE